ncbi:hypothetical protein BF49_7084 [Bradyrhizobium sp.]|nr:hypothetical protein BF49_3692 [Bradyrhizobium sp.]CUT16004.1 hypothetical protein BF49_7084 [Bradyrhizobium sp.]
MTANALIAGSFRTPQFFSRKLNEGRSGEGRRADGTSVPRRR